MKEIVLINKPKFNFKKLDKELFLYHRNLNKTEFQYSDSRFVGLCLGRRNHIREIQLNNDNLFPLPENRADAFQSQDVLEHTQVDKVVVVLHEIYRFLKPKGFCRISLPDYLSPLLKKDQYIIIKMKFFVICQ